MSIASSLARLQEEIHRACARAQRDPREITLVAVSKTFPASAIREAYAAGIRHVGENKVQEILAKIPELSDLDLAWHMVGSLQTNKVRDLLPHLGLLHSLDRLSLAEAVSRFAMRPEPSATGAAGGPDSRRAAGPVQALIQVNTTGEERKSGVPPSGLEALVDQVRALPGIELRGLMTIGPMAGSEPEIRRAFALLHDLRERLRVRHQDLEWPILSMGMSDDFPIAIAEGATHLRIGSRIFGARTPPPRKE